MEKLRIKNRILVAVLVLNAASPAINKEKETSNIQEVSYAKETKPEH